MSKKMEKAQKKNRPLWQRILIDIAGFGLIIISPLTGFLPGPGGIPIFLAGLGLVSLNHEWAANLLKNIEEKWLAAIDKLLLAHPKVSRAIDILCVVAITAGLYISFTVSQYIFKAMGFGLFSFGVVLMISNQKRIQRLSGWLKKH